MARYQEFLLSHESLPLSALVQPLLQNNAGRRAIDETAITGWTDALCFEHRFGFHGG
jgi:hypothetical protein